MAWPSEIRKEDVTGIAVGIGYTPIVAKRGGIERCRADEVGERGRITYVTRVAGRKIDYLRCLTI